MVVCKDKAGRPFISLCKLWGKSVAVRFVTTASFVTKVTKRAAMPVRFVTNEVVTNRAGIAPLFFTWISVHVRVCVCVCVCVCVLARARARACRSACVLA